MALSRRIVTRFAGVAALLFWGATATAQGFPDKPVRLIVPFPPGGGADTSVRIIVDPLSKRLGQQVVVDNRAGAGGIIGVRALKQADPDGYTIGLVVSGNTIQPFTTKALGFDVRKDFIPLSLVYTGPLVMTVLDSFPARSLAEFIDYAKANPGKVFYASAGTGTTTHLIGEMLAQVTGVPMTHVPFKGMPDAYNALFSGSVQIVWDSFQTPKQLAEAGKVRVLRAASRERLTALPQVPTFNETYAGFEVAAWVGLAAPLGVSKATTDRLAGDIRAVLQTADVRRRLSDLGLVPGGIAPAEFAQLISDEVDRWGKVTQAAGIRPE